MEEVKYESVIGLEIHVELSTDSKMFCGCRVQFGGEPNTRTCPICLGLPGSLPVINKKAVDHTVLIGLALGSTINGRSQFHRKNYFYPDMPKDYQISQYDVPVCSGGTVELRQGDNIENIAITRVHLEEDTGKLIHAGTTGRIAEGEYALVDFNRAGTPLVEIVTEPDIDSPEQARDFLKKLRNILTHLHVSDCNMEEGSMRCDANLSIRPVGSKALGTKVEIKNINSFRALHRAMSYEVERQTELLREGGVIVQETRHWDANRNITTSMRSKEEAHDYRYFAEPDLVPMEIGDKAISEIAKHLPELPDQKLERFMRTVDLPFEDAKMLTGSIEIADYFEAAYNTHGDARKVINWMMGELSYHLKDANLDFDKSPVSPVNLSELIKLIDDGTISGKIAKEIFEDMFKTGKAPKELVEEKGIQQITDQGEISAVIKKVIEANPEVVSEVRAGKDKAIGFLVGQVMKDTKGRANPKIVNDLLKDQINK